MDYNLDQMNKPHIILAQEYWKSLVKPEDLVIDMTCGNGHDTLFLANLKATVFGFDIQQSAIDATHKLVPGATLFCKSHDELVNTPLPQNPKLVVYNLGYLPGGDKSIVTKRSSTLESLKQALSLSSAISIMCYPGHEEGLEEEREILNYVKTLSPREWTVVYHQWINRPRAPSLFLLTSS